MVSSSMAARNPPCTLPAGLRNSGFASNVTSTVPRSPSIAANAMPSVTAQGGGGSPPSTIFQKNEFLSTALFSDCPNDPLAGGDVQPCQHLLHRIHRGGELFRIARADDEIGVRLLLLVLERVAADHGVGMGDSDFAQRTADIAFPRVGANRFRQHPDA